MTDIVFCFGVNGGRDGKSGNYHPASLYDENAEDPYHHDVDAAEEMIRKAFDSLPKRPGRYDRSDAGRGGWVRFDYHQLVSEETATPIQVTDE